jgi:hypothetical protein
VLQQVQAVLDEYAEHLPLTVRQNDLIERLRGFS